MKGRVNLFQASMLRWRDIHPYNAVHVIRMPGPLVAENVERAIDAVLETRGLTGLALDVGHGRYEWTGGRAATRLRIVAGGPDPDLTVDTEIERELNAPFPREGKLDPFRFFAVDRGETFDLGLGYDHFIAAGDSIVALLRAIVDNCAGNPPAVPVTFRSAVGADPVSGGRSEAPAVTPATIGSDPRYPPTYGLLFRRQFGAFASGLRRIRVMVASVRHASRPAFPHGRAPQSAFTHFRFDRDSVAVIRRAAKAWSVTFNDVVLALLMQALMPFAEGRRSEPRRNRLALAVIVNVRGDCGPEVENAFGQFLSSFLIDHAAPAGVTLETLARDIGTTTGRVKREKLYLPTLLAMGYTGMIWGLLSPGQRARFHGKAYPVWAGTSSLNVDTLWAASAGTSPLPEYLRAIPTGPIAPMVVAITTAHGELVLGWSYRTGAFSAADIAGMDASIRASIAACPR